MKQVFSIAVALGLAFLVPALASAESVNDGHVCSATFLQAQKQILNRIKDATCERRTDAEAYLLIVDGWRNLNRRCSRDIPYRFAEGERTWQVNDWTRFADARWLAEDSLRSALPHYEHGGGYNCQRFVGRAIENIETMLSLISVREPARRATPVAAPAAGGSTP